MIQNQMKKAEFQEDERVDARIGRVFFEGIHPDYEHVTTLLLLIPFYEGKGLRGTCYMQVAHTPDVFEIGQIVVFMGKDGWLRYPNGRMRKLNRLGLTKMDYLETGKIYKGG